MAAIHMTCKACGATFDVAASDTHASHPCPSCRAMCLVKPPREPAMAGTFSSWNFSDPFQVARQRLVRAAAVGASILVVAALVWTAWPLWRGGAAADPAAVDAGAGMVSGVTEPEVRMGEPVVIDDVEVTLLAARVGPVEVMDLLGKQYFTPDPFLTLELSLHNLSTAEVVLAQTWHDSRLLDERGRRLPRAFADNARLEAPVGALDEEAVKPGATVTDRVVFAWAETDAASMTFVSDPGFRRLLPSGASRQISLARFRLSFDRAEVQVAADSPAAPAP